MAATPSAMIELGTECPDFTLPDYGVEGGGGARTISRGDVAGGKALVVMFICNHCPFVQAIRGELARLGREYMREGVRLVAISSNSVETHPDDGPDRMVIEAKQVGYPFPYLYDESQEVAKAFRATCTPDFFVFDQNLKLVYRGQLDDSRPGNGEPVTGADLRVALDTVLAGNTPSPEQKPSIGCNIKWKPGNEPSL